MKNVLRWLASFVFAIVIVFWTIKVWFFLVENKEFYYLFVLGVVTGVVTIVIKMYWDNK